MRRAPAAAVAAAVLLATLLVAAAAHPVTLPQFVHQQPQQPSVVPLPDANNSPVPPPVETVSNSPLPVPSPSAIASVQGSPVAAVSPIVSASVSVSVAPTPSTGSTTGSTIVPSPSNTSSADDNDDDGGLSTGATIGIVIGAVLALLLLCCLLVFCCFRGRRDENEGGANPRVYGSEDAAPPPAPAPAPSSPGTVSSAPYSPDEARNIGPATAAAGAGMLGAGALANRNGDGDNDPDVGGTGEPNPTDLPPTAPPSSVQAPAPIPAGALQRGSTPPPHDYVLGAGPAATRGDFIDLRAKFERDEIGDNSAVLGVDRSSMAPSAGPSDTVDMAPATTDRSVGDEGATMSMPRDLSEVPGPPPMPPPVPRAPAAVSSPVDQELLPDREDLTGVPTFEAQEKMMAGGDGSGAISDAAMSLNAGMIVEETGDFPSLERDPMELPRERDSTF